MTSELEKIRFQVIVVEFVARFSSVMMIGVYFPSDAFCFLGSFPFLLAFLDSNIS